VALPGDKEIFYPSGISYLLGQTKPCRAAAQTCSRVSCSWDSAIWLCNRVRFPRKSKQTSYPNLPSSPTLIHAPARVHTFVYSHRSSPRDIIKANARRGWQTDMDMEISCKAVVEKASKIMKTCTRESKGTMGVYTSFSVSGSAIDATGDWGVLMGKSDTHC
jgi:hypothetical protein